ncbi:MAG: hypothetical protein NC226_09490 [Bacteroides cellulosilyticus]|nr:hypothetical protein [Bacteroides cellulosilyticus]
MKTLNYEAMKSIKITSFDQVDALYRKGVNICIGCPYERAASCVPERFEECTKQCAKYAKEIKKTHHTNANKGSALGTI